MLRRWTSLLTVAVACGHGDAPEGIEPSDALLDPQTCEECHAQQHREWLGSMHAYAAEDPVFRAMNARGQRETNGELGDFCIKCHAPLALALGLTEDGTDLDQVPQHLQGVTCYVCHNVVDVTGTHNNPLVLAMDRTMRGALDDAVDNDAHASDYTKWIDVRTQESGQMCGACHDIVTPRDVHLERTYAEWLDTFFADIDPVTGQPAEATQRCTSCHHGQSFQAGIGYTGEPMMGPIADAPGVLANRTVFHHHMLGIDTALTDFPPDDPALAAELRAEQLEFIGAFLTPALCASVCVNPAPEGGTNIDIWLHNEFGAHSWPSGAAQDRRAWLEFEVFAAGASVKHSGAIADDQSVDAYEAAGTDPDLWLLRDRIFDAQGAEVHMFWEAASYQSELLPGVEVLTALGDATTWRSRRFHVDADDVDRVTMRERIRAMDFSILDDLVASGDLDPAIRNAMPTLTAPQTELDWTMEAAAEFEAAAELSGFPTPPQYGVCISSSTGCGGPRVGATIPE